LDFLQAGMAGDSRDFVLGAPGFGKPPRARLPQPMRSTPRWQARIIAGKPKPIGKTHRRKWTPKSCGKESKITTGESRDGFGKLPVYRNLQFRTGFFLPYSQHPVLNMLVAHSYYIRSALTRMQKQCECHPFPRTQRMRSLEFLDFAIAPRVAPVGFHLQKSHAAGRVVGTQANFHGVPH